MPDFCILNIIFLLQICTESQLTIPYIFMTSTPVNSSLTDNLYLNQALLPALEQVELHLKDFANSEEFIAKMQ